MTDTKQIAETILQQLGGSRFIAMTGSSSFSSGNFGQGNSWEPGLSFRIGRNPKGITGAIITLRADDTYRVRFLKMRRQPILEAITAVDLAGVYADQLREIFERHTDLLTSLGTMRAGAREGASQ